MINFFEKQYLLGAADTYKLSRMQFQCARSGHFSLVCGTFSCSQKISALELGGIK